MKVIIAGGRNYHLTESDFAKLKALANKYGFTEIVSGGCSGADKGGEIFAQRNSLKLKVFPANWKKYGKAAGPIRNKSMAMYADALIVFPGGAGTKNMTDQARNEGLMIFRKNT